MSKRRGMEGDRRRWKKIEDVEGDGRGREGMEEDRRGQREWKKIEGDGRG